MLKIFNKKRMNDVNSLQYSYCKIYLEGNNYRPLKSFFISRVNLGSMPLFANALFYLPFYQMKYSHLLLMSSRVASIFMNK